MKILDMPPLSPHFIRNILVFSSQKYWETFYDPKNIHHIHDEAIHVQSDKNLFLHILCTHMLKTLCKEKILEPHGKVEKTMCNVNDDKSDYQKSQFYYLGLSIQKQQQKKIPAGWKNTAYRNNS